MASVQKATIFKLNKINNMPVIKITKETDLMFNEDRYFIRIDGKFIKGFETESQALDMADKLAANGGKEKTDEITIKEIIC